jgi:uncharacterized membrane protein YkoI
MNRKVVVIAALVLALGVGGAGIAIAAGGDDDDQPLTGAKLERATAAALAHTRGGTVTETEVGDDGAAYGVEVRLADDTQVEVQLDASFKVIGKEADEVGANDQDGPNDD